MTKSEDEIAGAITAAAKAEAENEEAEAARATSEAAATAVAAAGAATAIAKEESAIAQQRAAADIAQNQEDNLWLKETVTNLHKNTEALAGSQAQTMQELQSLKEATAGIASTLGQLIQRNSKTAAETETEVNPQKAAHGKEDAHQEAEHAPPPRKPQRRLL